MWLKCVISDFKNLSVVFSDFVLIRSPITCRENEKVGFYRQECDKIISSVIFNPYQWFISDFALISNLITCRENKKNVFFYQKCDKHILSVIFRPYQWFISDFILISSPITCCENKKVAFFHQKCDKNILSVILASYHPLISKKLIISRCAEVRTFSRRAKPSAWHYTSDSKFSAPHGDAIDFRYQISDFVVTLGLAGP